MKSSNSHMINIFVAIASLIAGFIAWIVCHGVYSLFVDTMWRPLLIAIMFLLLYFIAWFIIALASFISGSFNNNTRKIDRLFKFLAYIALGLVITFVSAIIFEFLYELNPVQESVEPTSYIFVIDDSGSMTSSDPQQQRYAAIEEIIKDLDQDFPYMIYSFSNDAKIIREMKPVSEGIGEITSESNGGTEIKHTLNKILEDYENKVWYDPDYPKVILLTDGYATDLRFFSSIKPTLKDYVKNNISISTVGLGNVDTGLMNNIAQTTGGVFIDVDDASDLTEAMKNAALYTAQRDLLSERTMSKYNVLFGILRILFLTILGTITGSLLIFAYLQDDSMKLIVISSFIEAFIGALVVEFGTANSISSDFTWLILWLLIAFTLGFMGSRNSSANTNIGYQESSGMQADYY